MFRNQVHRLTSVRFKSTSSSADIDALLDRVKNLTKGFNIEKKPHQKPNQKSNQKSNVGFTEKPNQRLSQGLNQKSSPRSNENSHQASSQRPVQNTKPKASSEGRDAFDITSTMDEFSFTPQQQRNSNQQPSQKSLSLHKTSRPVNIDRRVTRGRTERPERIQRASRDAAGRRTDFARGAPRPNAGGPRGPRGAPRGVRGAKGAKSGNRTARAKDSQSSGNSGPAVNRNLKLVSLEYHIDTPTSQKLLQTSPLFSHDPQSRILKTIRASLQDSNTDIGAVFRGELRKTDLSSYETHLKSKNLKFNAAVVANALDSNNSIDYATKVKILGPLIGAASSRELAISN